MVGFRNGHIRENITQNGEPQRYSWATQRKKKKKHYFSGTLLKSWTQKRKKKPTNQTTNKSTVVVCFRSTCSIPQMDNVLCSSADIMSDFAPYTSLSASVAYNVRPRPLRERDRRRLHLFFPRLNPTSSYSASPAIYLRFTIFDEIVPYVTFFFYPTVEVATFCLRWWKLEVTWYSCGYPVRRPALPSQC